MPVDTKHSEYSKMVDEWVLVRACSCGTREVKKLKQKLLPAPDEYEKNYDKDRYSRYIARAIYVNITGRTKNGLIGAAFRQEPNMELAPNVDYLSKNFDGGGQSLVQFSKDVLGSLLDTGRPVLLVDYPEVNSTPTVEEESNMSLAAHTKIYYAVDLINWDTQVINGQTILTLAVLRESYDASEDEFEKSLKDQYRVLRLTNGVYNQQVYRDGEAVTEVMIPSKSDGSHFDEIPIVILGSQNNDPSVDDIPLADIAHVNLGHYRNSADLEENAFVHGQLTLGICTDLDGDTWNKMNPEGVKVGSSQGHYLGSQGAFHSVQAEPNQLTDKLMERKEGLMLSLGAKLVEKRNPNETAAAAKIDATGENSVLSDLVTNLEEAINKCVFWCSEFMGESTESEIKFNREFFPDNVDPATIMASIQLYDRAIIAKSDLQELSRKSEIISADRTNEDIDNEVTTNTPIE